MEKWGIHVFIVLEDDFVVDNHNGEYIYHVVLWLTCNATNIKQLLLLLVNINRKWGVWAWSKGLWHQAEKTII